jgi:hypothetical protein
VKHRIRKALGDSTQEKRISRISLDAKPRPVLQSEPACEHRSFRWATHGCCDARRVFWKVSFGHPKGRLLTTGSPRSIGSSGIVFEVWTLCVTKFMWNAIVGC